MANYGNFKENLLFVKKFSLKTEFSQILFIKSLKLDPMINEIMAVSNKMMPFTTFRGTKFESLVFGIWQNKNPFQIYHLFNGFFHISKKNKNEKTII